MTYIKIALCDKDIALCSSLETMIINISKDLNFECDIDVFYSTEGLLRHLTDGRNTCHLLFLETELPGVSGIEIGRYIRETLRNQSLEIAFFSSSTDNIMNLFKLRPINFLCKPLTQNNIKEIFNTFLELKQQDKPKYHFKKGKEYYSIAYSDILYFENFKRKVMIHTTHNVIEHYASLEEIYAHMNIEQFWFVHKSFLVNYNYIIKFSYDHLTLTNHVIIPISQSKRAETQNKIERFLETKKLSNQKEGHASLF